VFTPSHIIWTTRIGCGLGDLAWGEVYRLLAMSETTFFVATKHMDEIGPYDETDAFGFVVKEHP
jgi:hypothetical protein